MNRQETGVYSVYKNRGETPLECIRRIRNEFHISDTIPMTYAGRLDPMAEGVLIILVGDMTKNKEAYLDLPKTYTFTILWGVATDTYDVLGVITDTAANSAPPVTDISAYLQKSIGIHEQVYPPYSSKPVMGKPLFQWAREGRLDEVNIPSHTVEIYSAQHLERRQITSTDALAEIIEGINSVRGDFRQEEIHSRWQDHFGRSTQDCVLDTIQMTVSSGFYVRQYVHDIGVAFHTPTTTYQIIRTAIGTHMVEK